jgi:RNA polymerase primary sigma factor
MDLIYYPKCLSLNETINEDGDELIELIPNNEDDVENQTEIDFKVKNELQKTLSILDDREKEIIENYFGINTNLEPMTLEAIGEKYDLTKERIRQIKEKAIRKLRHNANGLYSLMNE